MCGFLRGQVLPQPEASRKIGGITEKGKRMQEPVSNAGAGEYVAQKIPCPDQLENGHLLADLLQHKKRKTSPTQAEGVTPHCGPRPIVTMAIHWHPDRRHYVRVLLDTGCTTPLINTGLAKRLGLPCLRRRQEVEIRNFTGELVKGAGQQYTKPILLQHKHHYTKEVFEVAPLEPQGSGRIPAFLVGHQTRHAP